YLTWECDEKVAIADLQITWKDQGWGNRKGLVGMDIVRRGRCMKTVHLFGPAAHSLHTDSKTLDATELNLIEVGDVLEIWYEIGGGSGHTLTIEEFTVAFHCI